MSTKDSFEDYVFSLSKDDFELLKDSITKRNNMEKYRASSIEELALFKERPILCPACGALTASKMAILPMERNGIFVKNADTRSYSCQNPYSIQ